ncbi:c-type cytochrome [Entomobacter blattae]|uniref:Cytochrome c domain-containing protein n=1 Tax=Entomobacter blattae TaxID=2762277 RepID=A0A7H1NSI7_9PROT|nr:c-type cytochrome [Entomobacter blattae]QNT78747.1 hypothetical protein JGUZn3_15240 [Entomobacter blattae]
MNFLDWNKTAIAFVLSFATLGGCWYVGQTLVAAKPPPTPAIPLNKESEPDKAKGDSLKALITQANAQNGQHMAQMLCSVCHTFTKDAANTLGPNLYNIVNRPIASSNGYSYTPALHAKQKESWTLENLWEWLTAPQKFAQGTKMAFPGISDKQQLADMLAYLQTLSDSPPKNAEKK